MQKYSIRQRMQESLYQTADAEVSLSDSCLSQTADALSASDCLMRETLYLHQTADALSDSGAELTASAGCRVSPASAV